MNSLESILWELQGRDYAGTDDTYKLFSRFYKAEGKMIKRWVDRLFQNKTSTKSNTLSDQFRKQGNELYVKGKWSQSLEHYTKALRLAENPSKSYSMALANRSAVFYSLKEYQYSLSDINRCLCNYPDKFKYKVYVRKINCYNKIECADKAKACFKEAMDFINDNEGFTKEEKEYYIEKLYDTKSTLADELVIINKMGCDIPDIERSETFIGASTLIGLRSNFEKGRYVVAENDIQRGDILFVERAYAFAPIFDENLELRSDKCYYCLKNNKALIPCLSCSLCMYCNENCLKRSWNESHRWECKGVIVKLWSIVGLAFPAFRVYLKSLTIYDYVENCTTNYKLADKLLTNLENNANVIEFLILTAILVYYFESQTDFFEWLSEIIDLENDKNVNIFFGSCLLKNIAQIACNASVIEHWDVENYRYVPQNKIPVATGLYPAVSMMNHSCRANVSMYYLDDVVIVKAIDNIKQGEEICNCYGVDYRYGKIGARQSSLYAQYGFKCLCEICSNPRMELDYVNTFRCPLCFGGVSMDTNICYDCQRTVDLTEVFRLAKQAKDLLDETVLSLDGVEKSFKIMEKIYNQYHKNLADCYDKYKIYYFHAGDLDKSLEYFFKYVEVQKVHFGEHSLKLLLEILAFLDDLKMQGGDNRSKFCIQKISYLRRYIKEMFPLYFPNMLINYKEIDDLE